jgi:hypothetical protein
MAMVNNAENENNLVYVCLGLFIFDEVLKNSVSQPLLHVM